MPHHTSKTTTTVDHYSSESSSDKSTDSTKTITELAETQVYPDGIPKDARVEQTPTAQITKSQTNVGMFQTVNNHETTKLDQSKEKTTCCDCLLSLFLAP